MTYEEFYSEVVSAASQRPSYIRYGQAVFNYIDDVYGVARYVQFERKVDCFYWDEKADEFIKESWDAIKEFNNYEQNV